MKNLIALLLLVGLISCGSKLESKKVEVLQIEVTYTNGDIDTLIFEREIDSDETLKANLYIGRGLAYIELTPTWENVACGVRAVKELSRERKDEKK